MSDVLKQVLRQQHPRGSGMQCSDVEESDEAKTTESREPAVTDSGKTEEVGTPALMQEG